MNTPRIILTLLLFLGYSHTLLAEDCSDPPTEGRGRGGSPSTQAWDPNEKAGPDGAGDPVTQRLVNPGEELPYIIYFENMPDAAAAAQEVHITDALDSNLDWSTFRLGEVVFSNQTVDALAGHMNAGTEVDQTTGTLRVRIRGGIDLQTGVASWYLRCVDPATPDGWPEDPYAGFLPPNDETHRGEGHVAFTIRAKSDLAPQTRIVNAASIVFDYNDAIETNEVFNLIAGELPGAPAEPNPCDSCILENSLFLGWLDADLASEYDVYLWKQGQPKPAIPIARGGVSPFVILPEPLEDNTTYYWQVHARNFMGETSGPLWSFGINTGGSTTWMIY